jgi:acetylornithine aminotransferase
VVSTAAANATLEVFKDEDVILHVGGKGKRFASGILTLRNKRVKEVRSYGLMIAVELDMDYSTFRKMVEGASQHGLLVLTTGTETTLRLLPPLVITNAEIDEAVVRLGNMLDSSSQL